MLSFLYMFSSNSRCMPSFVSLQVKIVSTFLTLKSYLGDILDKVEHDSLGDHVGHGSLDNVVVG